MIKILEAILLAAALLLSVSCASGDNGAATVSDTTVTAAQTTDKTTVGTTVNGTDEPVVYMPGKDDEGRYLIKNADDMVWLADYVNSGGSEVGESFSVLLVNDVDISGVAEWTPVGNSDSAMFKGKFDGNGKTVSGLNINNGQAVYSALFGKAFNAVIKNLTLDDSAVSGETYVAGICAFNGGSGEISNCVNRASVAGQSSVGGICALNIGRLSGCKNYGEISAADKTVGGICGFSSSEINGCENYGKVSGGTVVGGICGEAFNGTVSACLNYATVGGAVFSGGIAGVSEAKIEFSMNSGEVTSTDTYAAGICANTAGAVVGCLNRGNVTAPDYYAGICARSSDAVSDCVNLSSVITPAVPEGGTAVRASHIVAYRVDGKSVIGGCAAVDAVLPENADYEALTAEDIASGRLCVILNRNNTTGLVIWGQKIGEDDFPCITYSKSKMVFEVHAYTTCDKSDSPATAYSNVKADIAPGHSYENGVCSVCGAEQPE